MSDHRRKIFFGLWYDFRNPPQWRQPSDRLYREILDQIAWGEDLESDPCLSLKLRRLDHIKDCPSLRPVLASLQMDNQRPHRSDPRPSR